uniref:Ribosome biogenesis protein WDR12 homolog n=1 Tax=Rhodnius prolixus TaxID=13249 RepID=T1I4N8_RHOPR
MSTVASTSESDKTQIQLQFFTKQPQYSVPDVPYAVPSEISIEELNSLINQLIKDLHDEIKKSIEFDFLAAGEFIRTSLGEHISIHGLSTETVLSVEYVERLPAPKPLDCLLHDDWVSAVHSTDKWILSGCYDNTLHLWTAKGKHLMTIPGHTGAVKAVSWVASCDDITTFVSASRDQTLLLWEWNTNENTVECVKTCKGHAEAVECVGVSKDNQRFASGGWDNMLKIWSTNGEDNEDDEESEAKKFKNDGQSQIKTPKVTLKGHKEAVTAVCWLDNHDLVTSSMDHTLRLWDTEMSTTTRELAGNKAFFDVHVSPISKLLITASSDKYVRMYDPRSTEGTICKLTFTSHQAWVTTVRWSTNEENLFISGSYDHQVKLWDTRSTKVPMFDLSGHEDNVLCSDWTNPELIVTGGSDNSLRIYRASSLQR